MNMKRLFKFLSRRPKSGNVKECIKPLVFYPQLLFCIWAMYDGMTIYSKSHYSAFIFAMISVIFAWQAGWYMSIERFKNSEKEKES